MRVFIVDSGSITTKAITLREDSKYPSYVHQIDSFARRVNTTMRLPTQNMIDELLDKYQHLYKVSGDGKTGMLVGSGASGWAGTGTGMLGVKADYVTRLGFLQLINIQAGMVAKRLGIEDYLATDATSCSSSLKCIEDAVLLINAGRVDRLLILGWDDQISSPVLDVFNGLKASISKECYEKGRLASAFDNIHGGFLVGAGIGFLVIESEKVCKDPKAEILGTSNRLYADFNPLSSKAAGYKKTMKEALSGLYDDIHVVKAHGTGTKLNNSAEREAILDVLGADNIVTSYKPLIGHTMGACGAIEVDLLLKDFKRGLITGIANNTTPSDQFINKDTKPRGNNFLINAAGMGGVYSTVVGTCIT